MNIQIHNEFGLEAGCQQKIPLQFRKQVIKMRPYNMSLTFGRQSNNALLFS